MTVIKIIIKKRLIKILHLENSPQYAKQENDMQNVSHFFPENIITNMLYLQKLIVRPFSAFLIIIYCKYINY